MLATLLQHFAQKPLSKVTRDDDPYSQ